MTSQSLSSEEEQFLRELDSWAEENEVPTGPVAAANGAPPTHLPHARVALANYYRSERWKALRDAALRRDSTCRFCAREAEVVHHRRWAEVLGEETVDDLTSLCRTCALRHCIVRSYCANCIRVILSQDDPVALRTIATTPDM